MVRSVLIGKERRITLEELQTVALYDGILELHAPSVEDLSVVASPTVDRFSAAMAALTLSDSDSLSSPETIAALTLLTLNLSQGRIIKSLAVIAGLIEFTNQAKSTSLVLPSDPANFQSALCTLFSSESEITSAIQSLPTSLVARTIFLSTGALTTVRAASLAHVTTPIAALSAERAMANLSAYAEVRYDINRPHRGLITTAATLRAILNRSQFCTTTAAPGTDSHNVPLSISNIPQYQGPAQESLNSACKTLELEINCFEFSATDVLDDTVAILALSQAASAMSTLYVNSVDRRGQPLPTTTSTAPLSSLRTLLIDLEQSLYEEAKTGVEFVTTQNEKAAQEALEKEAEKAARAAAAEAAPGADDLSGMSEAQRQKVLKKRAEKDAKAAAKKAAKQTKGVSLFGEGTQKICTILKDANFDLSETTIAQVDQCVDKLLSGGVQRKPKIAKGTRDYLPEQMMIRQQAFSIIRRVFESHGAVEIDTPVFELKDTLTGKYGEDSKLIYDLADQGGEMLALRYDLTVPFARFLALNSVGNIKRFHIGKVYRRDRPVLSKGRYREFYQCDFDIAGTYGRMVPDSECLCVACDILDALPIGDFAIKLNHRRLLDAILDICGVPAEKFRTICSAVDKLDKEPWEEVKREMVEDKGLKPEVADQIGTFVLQKGEPWTLHKILMDSNKFGKHKGALDAMEDLKILFEYLEAMGKLNFMSFDLSLARGLDYYTGVIYEAVCLSGTTQVGSIGGGGRYDNLVSMFQEAGKITPCVGVSVGIERVFTLMEKRLEEEQGSIKQPNVKVLVASAGDHMLKEKMRITRMLWDSNISAEFSQQENPKLKYEIANALDREIPFMVIVGEEELKSNQCKVKDLKARTEDLVPLDQLVKTLRSKGVIPVGCEFAADLFAREAASQQP
ncbi:Anticodon binding of tRNA [Fragilaria crotonensis]|nr:Anticodon binding of tRNA [Fragilaria crotonensis]